MCCLFIDLFNEGEGGGWVEAEGAKGGGGYYSQSQLSMEGGVNVQMAELDTDEEPTFN